MNVSLSFLEILSFFLFLYLTTKFLTIFTLCFFLHLIPRKTSFTQLFTAFIWIIIRCLVIEIWFTILWIFWLLFELWLFCAEFTVSIFFAIILSVFSFVPSSPSSVFHEFFEIRSNSLQKFIPINTDFVIIENDIIIVQPFFNFFHIFDWNRIDSDVMLIVLMNESQIEISDISSHSFKPNNFNVINAENKEVRLSNIDQTGFSWLKEYIWTECGTIKTQVSIWCFKFKSLVCKFLTSFRPSHKIFINSSLDFFLPFLIIWIFSSASANNILSHNTSLWIELNILSFLFSYQNGLVQSKMNGCYDFLLTRLEESKFNIGECNIDYFSFNRTVFETIKMTL